MRCGMCGAGDENWACLVRRRVGKGIQGACAPMAERCGGRFAAPVGVREQRVAPWVVLREQRGGAIGDLGALGGAR